MAAAVNLVVGQTFTTYDEFIDNFNKYCEQTKQIFCVSYSKSVERYNCLRTKKINSALKYACIQYTCKCGGKERHRGSGVRPFS